MSGVGVIILWVFFVIFCLVVYHKLFTVYYLGGVSQGFMKELVFSCLISSVLTVLTLKFWIAVAVILALIAVVAVKKERKAIAILLVVAIIIVAITGIAFNHELNSSQEARVKDGEFIIEKEKVEENIRFEQEECGIEAKEDYA